MKTEKPQGQCLGEVVMLLKKFPTLGIPIESPEVQELKKHLDAYVRDGECWSGTISFSAYGRIAEVDLPRRADKTIEVTLRPIRGKR